MTTIVAIVIAVVVVCKKQSKHRYVPIQQKHSQYTTASSKIAIHVHACILHCSGFIFIIVYIIYIIYIYMYVYM